MRRKRTWILFGIVVVAAALVWWRTSAGRPQDMAYRTEAVRRGDIRVQVSATGTLEAVTTVQVGSQVSGTISALYADFNDRVKNGQILAQLDPTFLRAQVAQNAADLNRTQVQVRQAQRDSARVFPLGAQGLASKADLDNAQTALDAARASAASARAALERAQTNLRYATITSPIDGVVISRNVDVGQTVAASLSAPTLFTIANDLTQMQLQAAVDEADIGQIRVGQPASFTVDAYPDLSFRGEVHQIRLSPETVQNVVTYTVIIHVPNPDQKLLPGMTANVTILVSEVKDVLRVPAMALRFRPPNAGAQDSRGRGEMGGPNTAGGAGGTGGTARGPGGSSQAGTPDRRRGDGSTGGRPGMAGGPGDLAGNPMGSRGPMGRIYLLEGGKQLRPLRVRTGDTDGTSMAVYSDSLAEGALVVLGPAVPGAAVQDQGVVNPFAPRMPGGGGRR